MRRSKCTDEPLAYALRQAEAGTAPAEIFRELGISELRELKQPSEEGHPA